MSIVVGLCLQKNSLTTFFFPLQGKYGDSVSESQPAFISQKYVTVHHKITTHTPHVI